MLLRRRGRSTRAVTALSGWALYSYYWGYTDKGHREWHWIHSLLSSRTSKPFSFARYRSSDIVRGPSRQRIFTSATLDNEMTIFGFNLEPRADASVASGSNGGVWGQGAEVGRRFSASRVERRMREDWGADGVGCGERGVPYPPGKGPQNFFSRFLSSKMRVWVLFLAVD